MQFRHLVVALTLAACNGSGTPGAGSSSAPPEHKPPTTATHKTSEATVSGVHFSLKVPASVIADPIEPGVWNGDALRVFAVVVDHDLVTSLDKAKYQSTLHMEETKFVRAEPVDGGYRLTSIRPGGEISAISFAPTPNGWLKCKATTMHDARELVESICDSVSVK